MKIKEEQFLAAEPACGYCAVELLDFESVSGELSSSRLNILLKEGFVVGDRRIGSTLRLARRLLFSRVGTSSTLQHD